MPTSAPISTRTSRNLARNAYLTSYSGKGAAFSMLTWVTTDGVGGSTALMMILTSYGGGSRPDFIAVSPAGSQERAPPIKLCGAHKIECLLAELQRDSGYVTEDGRDSLQRGVLSFPTFEQPTRHRWSHWHHYQSLHAEGKLTCRL